MDFEKENKQYMKDKKAFEKVEHLEQRLEKYKQDLKLVRRSIEDTEIAKKRAEEDNKKDVAKKAEEQLKKLKEKEEKLIDRGKRLAGTLNNAQDKVETHFKEIEKDPELKEHVDNIIRVKYGRQLKKVNSQQAQLESLKQAISSKPEISNNLKGMVRANEKLEELKKELEGLDSLNDIHRIEEINLREIPELQSKYKINKDMLMSRVNKINSKQQNENVEITSEFLDDLAKQGFSHHKADGKDEIGEYKKGDINITKSLNRIAKGYEKRKDFYSKAIEKVTGNKENDKENDKENLIKKIKDKVTRNKDDEQITSLVPVDEKISWLHPIKKFKSWLNRKQKDKNNDENSNENLNENLKVSSKKFKSAYKYDFVKDYVEDRKKAITDEIKNKNVNKEKEGRNEEHDDEQSL